MQEAVDSVHGAFAEIRASLAALKRSGGACGGAAPALSERPAHAARAHPPGRRRQPQQRQQEQRQQERQPPPRQRPQPMCTVEPPSWPASQQEQVDSPDRQRVSWQTDAVCGKEPQPRSLWPPAQPAAGPVAPFSGVQGVPRSRQSAAAASAGGAAQPHPSVPAEEQRRQQERQQQQHHQHPQQQQPGEQQRQWHWQAEAAALQVEQAACRREAAIEGGCSSNPHSGRTAAWPDGSHSAAGNAAAPPVSRFYADENWQAETALPHRHGGHGAAQRRPASPTKRGDAGRSSGFKSAMGADTDAGRLQRQQRLQQLYQELQLLDVDSS